MKKPNTVNPLLAAPYGKSMWEIPKPDYAVLFLRAKKINPRDGIYAEDGSPWCYGDKPTFHPLVDLLREYTKLLEDRLEHMTRLAFEMQQPPVIIVEKGALQNGTR